MSSHASRAHTRSHRYEVLCPSGFGGFPAPRLWPRLNGRNRVCWPSSRVVIATGPGRPRSAPARGRQASRSSGPDRVRYCSTASSMFWPVRWFFNSAVATGIPLTNRHRSTVFVESGRTEAAGSPSAGWRRNARPAPGRPRTLGGDTTAGRHALVDDAVTQHIERPALVDLLGQALHELLSRNRDVATVSLDQPRPRVRLCRAR